MATNYSSKENVRLEAGFTNNDNISDTTVESYQNQATGIINGIIAKRYDLNGMLTSGTFAGSNAQLMLARCEELIGAGHLLNKDYDIQDQEGNSNGDKKIEAGYKILNDIIEGNIVLVDNAGVQYPTLSASSAGVMVAYPTDDADRIFTKEMKR